MALRELTQTFPHAHFSLDSAGCHRRLAYRGRGLPVITRSLLLGFGGCHCALASWNRALQPIATGPLSGQRRIVEKLWREFFTDPSQWWDHRFEKENARYPDFKHKHKQGSLWLDGKLNPPWVEAELAAIEPGTLHSSVFSWNKKLSRYVEAGEYEKTIELFQQMQGEGISPDKSTFRSVLNACTSLRALDEGRHIHTQIINSGFESNLYLSSLLVVMYAECGSTEDARRVFNRMPRRDLVCWNAMILGYARNGQGDEALGLARQMQSEGVDPDPNTFVGLLNACANIMALEEGQRIHEEILVRGYKSDVSVGSSLVHMYVNCASMEKAWRVFKAMPTRGVVAWNAMILGYIKWGQGETALQLSRQMRREGVDPDPVAFVEVLIACASAGALEEGRHFHEQISQLGYDSDIFVTNHLLDMYATCGSLEDALRVFNKMRSRNVAAWSAMILGCLKCGDGRKALILSKQMQQEGVQPNALTCVALLNACATVTALEEGRRVHEQIIQSGYESAVEVGSSLVDMYAKCGSIEDAVQVFDKMPIRNFVSWNAMLRGYALHGCVKEAVEHFEQMCHVGVEINDVTFVSLLSACSHAGLVAEGLHYFERMTAVYNISPTVHHYVCMVDLLSGAGRLYEAEDLIRTMSCEPGYLVWIRLLEACRVHGNVDMGERVAKQVLQLEPERAEAYVLLSNIYAAAGEQDKASRVDKQRLDRCLKIVPGRTWIELGNDVHSFTADNGNHPQIAEIRAEVTRLSEQLKQAGCVPDITFASRREGNEDLCQHSDILAIAFGLISTPPGSPLRIFKNMPVCDVCHNASKFISRQAGRAIIVRDVHRFHHFQDGVCSCGEYW